MIEATPPGTRFLGQRTLELTGQVGPFTVWSARLSLRVYDLEVQAIEGKGHAETHRQAAMDADEDAGAKSPTALVLELPGDLPACTFGPFGREMVGAAVLLLGQERLEVLEVRPGARGIEVEEELVTPLAPPGRLG